MAGTTIRGVPAAGVPLPRQWSISANSVVAVLGTNGIVILGMWLRHGGLDEVGSAAGLLTGIGQLTALFGTYLALIQLVLMSRSPWLDPVSYTHLTLPTKA